MNMKLNEYDVLKSLTIVYSPNDDSVVAVVGAKEVNAQTFYNWIDEGYETCGIEDIVSEIEDGIAELSDFVTILDNALRIVENTNTAPHRTSLDNN